MKSISIIIIFLYSVILFGQDTTNNSKWNSGLVYGDGHAFLITVPKGWVLDNKSGVSQGLYAVFYPQSGSWEYSVTVMYANTASKKIVGNETIEKIISYDIEQYKKRGADIFKDSVVTIIKQSKIAEIKYFNDKNYGNYEIVAYIDEKTIVSLLVMSSRDKKEFYKYIPKFYELLNSYNFISDKVITSDSDKVEIKIK